MKYKCLVFVVTLLVASPLISSAHYFNQHESSANFYSVEHFQLISVKADREMGTGDNEDRFWFKFRFTKTVQSVEISFEAMDGTNDHDTRSEQWEADSVLAYDQKEKYCGDFPTHVDNVYIKVVYWINNEKYTHEIYVYSYGLPDQGSGEFEVDTSIPEKYQDSDGSGVWGTDKGLGQIWKYVKAPYTIIKWMFSMDTRLAFMIGGLIIFASGWAMLKTPLEISVVLMIPMLLGVFIIGGAIQDLINQFT
jgi:hypothetical protein